ncbi:MAG: hypothetical protein ABSH50_32605 [Bryobacteraceae bacterium]
MNVPLFVSFPQMRNNASMQPGPFPLPYTCSSVDLLPFLYSLALGNPSWRSNSNDIIYYLAGREAIEDAIYLYDDSNNSYHSILQERRISRVPLYSSACSGGISGCPGWEIYQPFVLHTADDYPDAAVGGNHWPSHAIAFRTCDQTDTSNNAAPFFGQTTYGGGKLGIYSYWDTCDQDSPPIMGLNSSASNTSNQYEFYNYSVHPWYPSNMSPNLAELGNQYFNSTGGGVTNQASLYVDGFFNNSVQNELYYLNNSSSGNNVLQVQAAIQNAFQNYIAYLNCANSLTGNNNNGVVIPGPGDACPTSPNTCMNCNNSTSPAACPPTYQF